MEKRRLGYRKKVVGVVIDKKGNFLIVNLKSYSEKDWNFPGGGIEPGETEEATLLRELKEEIGNGDFEIIKKAKKIIKVSFPDSIVEDVLKRRGKTWKGQAVRFFLVEYVGDKNMLPEENEIRRIKWVAYKDLRSHFLFSNQWEIAEKIIAEFALKD